MDVAALARSLADAGGWAVAVSMGAVLGIGFVRGWLVPGWLYAEAVKREETSRIQAERNTESIALLTRSVEALTEEVRWDIRDRFRLPSDPRPNGA